MIQFGTVSVVSPGVFRLGNLLRGRLGSEWAINSHMIGERFALLDEAVVAITLPASTIGQTLHLRASTFGDPLTQGTDVTMTLAGVSLKPYSPVALTATRALSGDVTLTWTRRARIDGGLRDYIDVPLKEAAELYDVIVYNGASEKRHWRLTNPSVVYSAADQTADFGSLPSTLSVKISQVSALAGPGTAAIATLTVN